MATLGFENTDRVLKEERLFRPSDDLVANANITAYMRSKGFTTYEQLHQWSVENRLDFWADMAGRLHWFKKWDTVHTWDGLNAKWFVGGQTNICYNAVDRHMGTPVEQKVAFHWVGEDGAKQTWTYADMFEAVNRLAVGLQNMGIKRGDRVTIFMPRVVEQAVAMLAVARIGAVHSVVYSAFSSQALLDRIYDAESVAVITTDGYRFRNRVVDLKKTVDEAVAQAPSIKHVIVSKRTGHDVPWDAARDTWWDDALAPAGSRVDCAPTEAEDMLYALYTSGSTGKPKGVVHVHGGYSVGVYTTAHFIFDIKPDDVFWCTADPGWVTGHSYIVYGPMMNGVTSIFYEGAPDYPDPGRWWSIVQEYGVTVFYTAPTAVRALMRHGDSFPGAYNLASLRLLGSVGEPINPEAWMWYRKVTGDKLPIMDTWWQTETGSIMITPTPIMPLKPGSATKPFLGVAADVVDKDGNSVGHDKGGFLVIRHPWPSMMRTIFRDPARYETYWNTIPNVYFAGDAAHKDADGYFWIQGRVDDVIKKSGYRLGSMEIESSLVSHPAVAEAAVIGKPDELRGESIKAFVILKTGIAKSDALLGELRQHVRSTVGVIATPDELEFVDGLPKTRSGKIMRRVLKARELGEPVGDLSTLEA